MQRHHRVKGGGGLELNVMEWGNAAGAPLVDAVDWNRKLWRTLAADCMDDRNTLTQDVRAKIISLSLWVAKYSRAVTREKASLDPLIEINRTIMQGLQAS